MKSILNSSENSDNGLLIVSSSARKRMQFLLATEGHEFGEELPVEDVNSGVPRESILVVGGESIPVMECQAGILENPVDGGTTVLQRWMRDSEIGMTEQGNQGVSQCRNALSDCVGDSMLLEKLQVTSGALVEVANPDRPEILPRLARLWASEDGIGACSVKVSPFLAFNLGIPYHLIPFLGSKEQSKKSVFNVSIFRYTGRHGRLEGTSGDLVKVSNPGNLEPASVVIATEVDIAVVREPANSGDLMPESLEQEQGDSSEPIQTPFADSDTATQCITSYFASDVQLVSKGDIFAVPVQSSSPNSPGSVIAKLNAKLLEEDGVRDWRHSQCAFLYFKVRSVKPEVPAVQAVVIDPRRTQVTMTGVTGSNIPVGSKGYVCKLPRHNRHVLGWSLEASYMEKNAIMIHVGALLPLWRDIARIIAPLLHPYASQLKVRSSILLYGPDGAGKRTATSAAAVSLGMHHVSISCRDLRIDGLPEDKVLESVQAVFEIAGNYRPILLLLRDIHLLAPQNSPTASAQGARLGAWILRCMTRACHDNVEDIHLQKFPQPLILIACAPKADDVEPGIRRCFTHEVEAAAPGTSGREIILKSFLSRSGCSLMEEDWGNLTRHTAGLLPNDLRSVAAEACSSAALTTSTDEPFSNTIKTVPIVSDEHIDVSIASIRDRTASDIGAPRIPNVKWDDVGGLEDVKLAILDTVELPLKHPGLFAGGLRRRSGVLLYGPPGTGKTLLAKAVATECSVNFLSVKGPELINMYVGESERLVREVFEKAHRARPCVIFFDELDSLAPARGRGSDSGGVMDRVVSQLLAEIDSAQGGSGTDDIFIIGATNRPDLLDPALLRPGRLDKLLYIGIASDPLDRMKVLTALTRRFDFHDSVDLLEIAKRCPGRLTGADMYGLCSGAWMSAMKRHASSGNAKYLKSVVVSQEDFLQSLSTVTPSLSAEDVAVYEQIRASHS